MLFNDSLAYPAANRALHFDFRYTGGLHFHALNYLGLECLFATWAGQFASDSLSICGLLILLATRAGDLDFGAGGEG